jgi:hypothetical protein
MREIITFDKFLSVWIVLYSIGYILQIFPFNPLILLAISILFFIFALIIIIYNHNKNSNLLYFFLINFIFKIPIFAIVYYRNEPITEYDFIFTFYVIVVYIIYIEIMNDNIYCIYRDMISFIINKNKGRYPQIFYNLKNYKYI